MIKNLTEWQELWDKLNEAEVLTEDVQEAPAEVDVFDVFDDIEVEPEAEEEPEDKEVENKVVAAPEETEEKSDTDTIKKLINNVMCAYQNANKWLDSTKEGVYMRMSCPFFSSFIHKLAHTMPERFDSFGDILHTANFEIPYPATAEIAKVPDTIDDAFSMIFEVLGNIKTCLVEFIKGTDTDYHGMSCGAEALLNDIESEYPMLYRLQAKWTECHGNTVEFDKYVQQYVDHKNDLLESFYDFDSNYLVVFVTKSGENEEYYYATRAEADDHLDAFLADDSGLYKRIAILNTKTNAVERILVFNGNSMIADLEDGDVVRIRPEWRSANESGKDLYVLSDIHEETGNCLLKYIDVDHKFALGSIEPAGVEMVEKVASKEDMLNGNVAAEA